jgi:hypothetical protein
MKDKENNEKSWTRNEGLRFIMDSAAVTQKNHESIRKSTRADLKRAHFVQTM